jgi:hypothetical protein
MPQTAKQKIACKRNRDIGNIHYARGTLKTIHRNVLDGQTYCDAQIFYIVDNVLKELDELEELVRAASKSKRYPTGI